MLELKSAILLFFVYLFIYFAFYGPQTFFLILFSFIYTVQFKFKFYNFILYILLWLQCLVFVVFFFPLNATFLVHVLNPCYGSDLSGSYDIAVSTLQISIATYFSIFQRAIWSIFKHGVIKTDQVRRKEETRYKKRKENEFRDGQTQVRTSKILQSASVFLGSRKDTDVGYYFEELY